MSIIQRLKNPGAEADDKKTQKNVKEIFEKVCTNPGLFDIIVVSICLPAEKPRRIIKRAEERKRNLPRVRGRRIRTATNERT